MQGNSTKTNIKWWDFQEIPFISLNRKNVYVINTYPYFKPLQLVYEHQVMNSNYLHRVLRITNMFCNFPNIIFRHVSLQTSSNNNKIISYVYRTSHSYFHVSSSLLVHLSHQSWPFSVTVMTNL